MDNKVTKKPSWAGAGNKTRCSSLAAYDAWRYGGGQKMICGFFCSVTEKLFHDELSRRLPTQIQGVARRKLLLAEHAGRLDEHECDVEIVDYH